MLCSHTPPTFAAAFRNALPYRSSTSSAQARAGSLGPLMAAAAEDYGRPLDREVVAAVWRKLLPHLESHFDAAHSLVCIAPRREGRHSIVPLPSARTPIAPARLHVA